MIPPTKLLRTRNINIHVNAIVNKCHLQKPNAVVQLSYFSVSINSKIGINELPYLIP